MAAVSAMPETRVNVRRPAHAGSRRQDRIRNHSGPFTVSEY